MLESVSELYQPMCLPLKLLNSLQTFLSDHISFVLKFIHFYPLSPLTELIRDVWLEFCLLNLSILLASSFLWNLCSQHSFFLSPLFLLKCAFLTCTGCMWPYLRADTEWIPLSPSPASFQLWLEWTEASQDWARHVLWADVFESSSWLLDNEWSLFPPQSLVLSSWMFVRSDSCQHTFPLVWIF